MNGEVAQLAALVTHGNAFLSRGGEPPELFPANSTFMYVNGVSFAGTGAGTAPWLESLRSASVRRLWLHLPESSRMLSGFVGGMHAALWADGPRRSVWTPAWEVLDLKAPDRRIWSIAYSETPLVSPVPPPTPAPGLPAELDGALSAAEELARRHDYLAVFAPWFTAARAMLASDDPVFEHHEDLVPAGWSLEARRLLVAAERAWVFGAMGSWNDIGFEDKELESEYKAVSERLYDAVCAAVVTGANVAPP